MSVLKVELAGAPVVDNAIRPLKSRDNGLSMS